MQRYVLSIAEDTDAALKNGVINMLKSMPFIKLTEANESLQPADTSRKLGGLEGKVWMSDDFNEPMEEFGDYM